MADREALSLLRQLTEHLREEGFPVLGLVLYGSMARGVSHEKSDIDVLARADDAVPRKDLFDLAGRIQRVAKRLDTRFEITAVHESFFETDDRTPLIELARTEGVRVAA